MENEDVTRSKDCDMLDNVTTEDMLTIYHQRPNKRNIFNDFQLMDDREKNYIRPLYEQVVYGPSMEINQQGYYQYQM